ncbi:MAG: hypothetical protein ACLQGV_05095 [Bryobacteraceae bacterium]
MPRSELVLQYIWWLTIAGHLLLYLKLRRIGLHRTYRAFSGYLAFTFFRGVVVAALPWVASLMRGRPNHPFATNVYAYAWLATEPVVWVFYVLVVLELFSLILQNFKGIASLGRWVMLGGLAAAVAISTLTLSMDLSNASERFPILRVFLMVDRGVASSLVIFLLVISCFLAWYPVPLCRNVVVHCMVYAGYFLSLTLGRLLRNLTGSAVNQTVNLALSGVTLASLLAWIAFLDRAGESVKVRVRPDWAPGDEEELVAHLAAINSSLLRTAHKQ